MTALQQLALWNSKHKSRCFSIEHDDGYGGMEHDGIPVAELYSTQRAAEIALRSRFR